MFLLGTGWPNIYDELTDKDLVSYAYTVRDKLSENALVMSQIENNTPEQAMLGDFPKAIDDAVMDSNEAHQNQMMQQQFPLRVIFNEYQQDRKKFSVQNATVILLHKHYIFYKHLNTQFNKKLACCHFESTYQFQAY